jgi:hypothetical protein
MQKITSVFFLGLLAFLLYGCPIEDEGFVPNTPLLIKNSSSDSLHLRIIYQRSELIDSNILQSEIDQTTLFSPDENLGVKFSGGEIKEYIQISQEGIEAVPFPVHIFLINRDSLQAYNVDTWDREAGVKRYFFYNLEGYQQINFTMEYP